MEFSKIKFFKKNWNFGKLFLRMEFRKIEFKNQNFGKLFLRMEFRKIKFKKFEFWKIKF